MSDASVATHTETPVRHVIAIVGPTAAGKSALAEDLALVRGGEIVSADSMQVYRGMDVGTAKVPAAERRVPYHCIDLVEPGAEFSAALYQRAARTAIAEIATRGGLPVVVGGTGLYVRAALDVMEFAAGQVASPARERLEHEAETLGAEVLHERLAAVDPAAAALIHPNNVRRTIRALELAEAGESYAERSEGFGHRVSYYPTEYIGLALPRQVLYERIGTRVDAMLAEGLLDEIADLLDAGLRKAITAAQAIGYKEFVPVIDGLASIEDAAESVKQATRRYAKRQLTWFRADPRVRWIDVTELSPERVLERAVDLLESDEPAPYPFGEGE